MQIDYDIRETPIGKGLFTMQHIKEGSCIWRYNSDIKSIHNVIEYNEKQCKAHLASMPSIAAAQQFLDVTYGRGNMLCLIIDSGRFINHAAAATSQCNCRTDMLTGHVYAIKDISDGDELFEDYNSFDHPAFLYGLLEKYDCMPTYYSIPM